MDMTGKVAIVTGGAQGIGKGVAMRLLREGMKVVIAEKDAEALREAEKELRILGQMIAVETDVGVEADVERLIAETLDHFDGIDALISNAGEMTRKPIAELTLAEWNHALATNLTGAFLCAKHAAPHLARHSGVIINIASTRAHQSEKNTESYAASKGGLVSLTHALAVSLGPDVRVNA